MSKISFLSRKNAGQAPGTRKKNGLISIAIGGTALLIMLIASFACAKNPVPKLLVEDMVVGTGREAKAGDTLIVEYIGWLYGAERSKPFDMTGNHDDAFEFVLGKEEAIKGFDQGLAGMKVGGQRRLTVPADLAYGSKGALNGKIPPNTPLVFEVELLGVLPNLPPTTVKALKVEDLKVGTGAEAKPGKHISIHYTGYLEDGIKFDSSYDSNQPIEFDLGSGRVIPGWEKGIVGMKVGGKRKLTIPPSLGYGEKGASSYVPPNATLIFEVELLAVKDANK